MIKTIVSTLALLLLAACSTPATQQSMSIALQDVPAQTNPGLKGKVVVGNVTGGKETNPMWTSQVDTQSLKGALDKSIALAGYKAAEPADAKYRVDAHLNELNQPTFGISFDVVSTILYTITGEGKQKQIPVTATGTAGGMESFMGNERLRLANERSIKENLKLFIQKLSEQTGW